MTTWSEAVPPGWQGWVLPFSAAFATAAVIWGVQALVVPTRQALARDRTPAAVPARPPCPYPPVGVQAPVGVRAVIGSLDPIALVPLYQHRQADGLQLWRIYARARTTVPANTQFPLVVLPALTEVHLEGWELPDGTWLLDAAPCVPPPLPPKPSTGGLVP